MGSVIGLLVLLVQLYVLILFIRVLLSWLSPYPRNAFMRFFWLATEPVLAPIRRRIGLVSGFDLSPLIVFVAAAVLLALLNSFRP
jgi:YggT family protein